MTVQNLIVKNIASGNGSTTQWPFTFACPVDHPEYIKVYIKGASGKATATTDFSVNMTNKYVTYPVTGSVLASGEKIIIARELPLHQILNLVNQGPFYAEDLEVTYDELVMMIQQLNEQLGRSLKVGVDIDSDSDIDVTIPVPTDNDVHSLVLDKNGFKLFSNPGDAADYAAAAQNAASVAEVAKNQISTIAGANYQQVYNTVVGIDSKVEQAKASAISANNSSASALSNAMSASTLVSQLQEALNTLSISNPVVDKTLSVEGAAGEAKTVGEFKNSILATLVALNNGEAECNVSWKKGLWGNSPDYNNFDTFTASNLWAASGTISLSLCDSITVDVSAIENRTGEWIRFMLLHNDGSVTTKYTTSGAVVSCDTSNVIAVRINVRYGAAGSTIDLNQVAKTKIIIHNQINENLLKYCGVLPNNTNANDIVGNGYYLLNSNYQYVNIITNSGLLFNFVANERVQAQLLIQYNGDNIWYRRKVVLTEQWTEWKNMSANGYNGVLPRNTNADLIGNNGYYLLSSGYEYENVPVDNGFLFNFVANERVNTQVIIQYDGSCVYHRRKVVSTQEWTEWVNWLEDNSNVNKINPKYYAFGDSVTWGAKWLPSDTGHTIVQTTTINQLPTRISQAIGTTNFVNNGVSGMGFLTNPSFLDKIQATNLDNADLITLQGGRNDTTATLGSTSSVAGDGTICGSIKSVIEYLRTNYPFAQIVFIQPTPNARNNNDVFNFKLTTSQWSLNEFAAQVKPICESYGVPFITWDKCQYIYHWASYTGVDGNYSHPNNDRAYQQMGAYLGGEISKYYKV